MKILTVCQYYYPEPFRVHELCEALVQRGHQVTVLTGVPNYPMGVIPVEYQHKKRREEVLNGVHMIRVSEIPRRPGKIGLAKNYLSFLLSACWRALWLKKEFDVILVYQLSPVLMAIPAFIVKGRSKARRIVLYCLDLWPESLVALGISKDCLFFQLIRWVSQKIYNGVDEIAYTSQMFRHYFKQELKLKQKRYVYIPQFADSLFEQIEAVQHEGVNLVFAGNVGELQCVDTVVRAAALVNRTDIRWHIVGDGSALETCKALASSLHLEGKVIFYGRLPVEEMPGLYAIADAMLVTLAANEVISYTLPGKVQSYMAAGKAIIGAVNGETARVIAAAGCGLCCAAEDAEGLAELVEHFTVEEGRAYGGRARDYYQENYRMSLHVTQIERVLGEW